MLILVVDRAHQPERPRNQFYLFRDAWNDWYEFVTQFRLMYYDAEGARHIIGDVKIAQANMAREQMSPVLPDAFDELDDSFFSVGQDDSYYENLKELGPVLRERVLSALRDIAADEAQFEKASHEYVTQRSLFRSVTATTVRGQFRRMARGDARLTEYSFAFTRQSNTPGANPVSLDFAVLPESWPPTNIHILIGRNGVGKTHLLGAMTRSFLGGAAASASGGVFSSISGEAEDMFSALVTVSFSAFDSIPPLSQRQLALVDRGYQYIGLNRVDEDGRLLPPKDAALLAEEFKLSVRECSAGARRVRWQKALETLESDPLFEAAGASSLLVGSDEASLGERAERLFRELSSGHAIVLLTITRLVELVEERTLVLLDEPESHLHPPLLSAFIRALSDLLVQRNGVAIVATHSPVILQEVPRSSVWKLRRSGTFMNAERPGIETFGENVGVLTREVFGLEVTHAGFHRLLEAALLNDRTYEQIDSLFGGQLGAEAHAIVRALIAARDADTDR